MDAFIAARTALGANLTADTLLEWQLTRLRSLLKDLIKESAFFGRRLSGVRPEGVTSPEALSAIPFTTAADLRAMGSGFCRVPQREVSRIVTLRTSGTDGEPKRIYFGEADLEATRDFYAHGMAELLEPGEKALIFMGGSGAGGMGALLAEGIARLGGRAIFYGPVRDEAAAARLLEDERAECVIGLPAQIFRLARLNPHLRPKTVLCSGDYLPLAVRVAVERIWRCEVFDHYGLTESGYGGAVECRAHTGYHLREADLLTEIVDPSSGRILPEGEAGEVVITTLGSRAMPLLRYRTGDRARLLPPPCACGSPLRRLGRIEGRIEPCSGDVSINELDELLFSFPAMLGYESCLRGGKLYIAAELVMPDKNGMAALSAFLAERLCVPFTLEAPARHKETAQLKRKIQIC